MPKGHALASRQVIQATDIKGLDFINISHDEGVYERIEACFHREAVAPSIVAECTLTTGVCALVENGVGIALIEHGAAMLFAERDIVLRRFEPAIAVTFYAYWLRQRTPTFRRSRFIQILQEEGRTLSDRMNRMLGIAVATKQES
jgi:DNA-binding transcriptional LysR family regulator